VKILSFVMLFVCASAVFGQSNSFFYVSKNGDDSNAGTQTAPWRTVQHAADTARAGSIVNVRGGVYGELVSINVSGNATDGYVTFRSYPGEKAVLDAEYLTPSGRQGVLTIHNRSYDIWKIADRHLYDKRVNQPCGLLPVCHPSPAGSLLHVFV
jgi:Protein of unknown function (DUF1565)